MFALAGKLGGSTAEAQRRQMSAPGGANIQKAHLLGGRYAVWPRAGKAPK
jgi:hypothetical protein